MNAINRLVAAALAVSALAAPAIADVGARNDYRIEFVHRADQSAEANYVGFVKQARRACEGVGPRPLAVRKLEETCIANALDELVAKIGRSDIAALHFDRTGHRVETGRVLAAR